MKTILRYEFDFPLIARGYEGNCHIIFENPSYIPQTGDVIDFQIEDFFDDEQVVAQYERVRDSGLICAEKLYTRYKKDEMEIVILLYAEEKFQLNSSGSHKETLEEAFLCSV